MSVGITVEPCRRLFYERLGKQLRVAMIWARAGQCVEQNEVRTMSNPKSTIVTREELYRLVWETPMQTLAESFGISGNGLAKICDKMRIPYPARGYWAKAQAGKATGSRPKLPAHDGTMTKNWTITATIKPTVPELPIEIVEATRIAQTACEEATERFAKPFRFRHPLTAKWKSETANGHRSHPRLSGVRDKFEDKGVLGRRLRILDALFMALMRAGAKIDENTSSIDRFALQIGGHKVEAKLVERLKQVREPVDDRYKEWSMYRNRPWNQKLVGTAQLVFRIESYTDHPCTKEWKDKDGATIEQQIGAIAQGLIVAAHYVGLREKRFADERERWAIEQRRREEIARQKQAEEQRLKELMQAAEQWQKAQLIRGFVRAVQARAADEQGAPELTEWVAWAGKKADEMDGINSVLRSVKS